MLICDRSRTKHYRDDQTGREYLSVSSVLNCLDPTRFKTVRQDVLDRACVRGTQVHQEWAKILAYRAGLAGYETYSLDAVPPAIRGYARAILDWADEHDVYALRIEDPDRSPLNYAGTPDGKVRYGSERRIIIPELKSGIEERLNKVQVQAYWRLKGYEDAEDLLLLYVDKDGKHKERWVKPNPHHWAWFQSGIGVLTGRLNNF